MNDAQYKLIVDGARAAGATFPTQASWLRFKAAIDAACNDDEPALDLARFFDAMRAGKVLGPTLSSDEVQGCEAIIKACAGWPVSWTAYALATAYHETAGTMQPIRERGGPAYFRRMYDPKGARPGVARTLGNTVEGDGVQFAGRGYVQLTGRRNYALAQEKLGAPFVGNPDLALEPDHAAAIMARGMSEGWFTGKTLASYLPETGKATAAQFREARRIINGVDRAAEIATYAMEFQRALL